MAKEVLRLFKLSDDEMLERAQVFHDQLGGELADFTARFPWLDAAWLTAFQADITAADAFPKDESVTLDLKILTGDVTATMQQGTAALQTLGSYARLAYPNDTARQRVFGQQYWSAAYSSTLKLQEALELAYAKANSAPYNAALIDRGYTQPEIDQLGTLADDLQARNGLQEALKMGRHVTKGDRIALLNAVWEHMQTINTCASVVWVADAERLVQYKMYPSSTPTDDQPVETSISGTVTASINGLPLQNVEIMVAEDLSNAFSVFTDAEGNYLITSRETEPATLRLTASTDGYEPASIDLYVEPPNTYTDIDFALVLIP